MKPVCVSYKKGSSLLDSYILSLSYLYLSFVLLYGPIRKVTNQILASLQVEIMTQPLAIYMISVLCIYNVPFTVLILLYTEFLLGDNMGSMSPAPWELIIALTDMKYIMIQSITV